MLKRSIKALVALCLIALLIRGVDWDQAAHLLQRVSLAALAVALAMMLWELVLSAMKWRWTLRVHALEYRFAYLLQVLAKAYFMNNFLPTAVGGDAYRAYRTVPGDGLKSRAISAVLLDRVSGLCALIFWGAVAAVVMWNETPVAEWYLGFCAVGALVGAVGLFIVYKGWLKPLTNRVRHLGVFKAIEHNAAYLLRARGEWVYVIGLSLLFQATSILLVYWFFVCVGVPITLTACALMAAASGLAAVLPISIAGIGVMEGSLVGMAVALGVEYDAALLVAILRRLMMFVLSVLCGTLFLVDREPLAKPGASAAS